MAQARAVNGLRKLGNERRVFGGVFAASLLQAVFVHGSERPQAGVGQVQRGGRRLVHPCA